MLPSHQNIMFSLLAPISLMLLVFAPLILPAPLPAKLQSHPVRFNQSSRPQQYGHETFQIHKDTVTSPNDDAPEFLDRTNSSLASAFAPISPTTVISHPATTTGSTVSKSYILQISSRWDIADISSVIFGILTSILGIFALLLTYFLNRRHHRRQQTSTTTKIFGEKMLTV